MYLEENLKLTPKDMTDKAAALDELQEMHNQVYSLELLLFVSYLLTLV